MFIYLSKKIKVSIPVECIQWNREQGWIAVGGDEGLLKVLKLDGSSDADKKPGAPSSLTMNQALEGHNGTVQCVTWNEQYRKLTTSDQYGLIIVWMLYKGQWYEEMINNRNKSVVRAMKWNSDGQRICIVYQDGCVIVGGVEGARLWGKELKVPLNQVEWSPDGKRILFGTGQHDIQIFDHSGNFLNRMALACLQGTTGLTRIVGIHWYNGAHGYVEPNCPSLVICFENGRMQIMRSEIDDAPILIDTEMRVVQCQWNHRGTVIALAGAQTVTVDGEARENNVVQFYNLYGDHLRTLKVAGKSLRSLSWEGGSLRLALGVDQFIYFANVRPDYKWGYFNGTVVYAFNKPERAEHVVVFWDTKLGTRQIKYVKHLLAITGGGDHSVLCTRADDASGQFVLIVCNANGTPVDSKYIDIEPLHVRMNGTHIAVASKSCVYVWNYKAAQDGSKARKRDEKIFHIDDNPAASKEEAAKFKKAAVETDDDVCCLALSDKMLMVGRESGTLQQYSLPKVSLERKHLLNCRPDTLAINCNSTRVSIIDISGTLTFFDPEVAITNPETGEVTHGVHLTTFKRTDVWDMQWAKDNPELFAMMEKTYMYIFRDLDPEEPVTSSAHICHFDDLHLRGVNLDEIMKDPEHPTKENLLDMEIKALRDTRELLAKVTIVDAAVFIEQNPHPRLWRLLAEAALAKLDLEVADKAFVRSQNYSGVEFVKRLQKLSDARMQKAEVAAYFRNFEEADALFVAMDRRDLAINMRIKLGDWFRVVQHLKAGGGGHDALLEQAWNRIGDYYADRQRYKQAVMYYVQGRNQERLADCYYLLEDYLGLESMVSTLPDNHYLLGSIAQMFATVGLCTQAVNAFKKCGKIKEAINICVTLNQWDLAVQLAKQHNMSEINTLLANYASHLLAKGKTVDAIELYRKARCHLDAAKLLFQLGEEAAMNKDTPLRAKKLFVLAALQVEEYRESHGSGGASPTKSVLGSLLDGATASQAQMRMIDTAWHGAEGFHLYLLAQKQLLAGQVAAGLRTACRLADYDDIVDPLQVHSLLSYAALRAKSYGIASKAFIKLESLGGAADQHRREFEDLSLKLFTRHAPKDPTGGVVVCTQCSTRNPDTATSCVGCDTPFLFSVVTGRPMVELEFWICGTCKHRATEAEITPLKHCPLCHSPV